MKSIKACPYCHKEFMSSRSSHVFCCQRCRSMAGFKEAAVEQGDTVCKQCSKVYTPPWPGSDCCNRSCSTKWLHANRWTAKGRTCKHCGKTFMAQRKDAEKCDECRKALKSARVMKTRGHRNKEVRVGIGSGGGQHYMRKQRTPMPVEIRTHVIERDSNTCQVCKMELFPDIRQLHHVNMDGADHAASNVVCLCRNCHGIVHAEIKRRVRKGAALSAALCAESLEGIKKCRL